MTTPDELERLARAATPGPWVWTPRVLQGDAQYAGYGDMGGFVTPNGFPVCWFGDNETYYPTEGTPPSDTDTAFIAAANPATILAILSERAELLAAVERMRAGLESIAAYYPPGHRIEELARAALTTGEVK
jgi:hypothetical protein